MGGFSSRASRAGVQPRGGHSRLTPWWVGVLGSLHRLGTRHQLLAVRDGGVRSSCIEAAARCVCEVLDAGQDLQASVRCVCMHETGSAVPNLGQCMLCHGDIRKLRSSVGFSPALLRELRRGMGTANEGVDTMISPCLSDSRRVLRAVRVQDP